MDMYGKIGSTADKWSFYIYSPLGLITSHHKDVSETIGDRNQNPISTGFRAAARRAAKQIGAFDINRSGPGSQW